jgi:hypothetical protein
MVCNQHHKMTSIVVMIPTKVWKLALMAQRKVVILMGGVFDMQVFQVGVDESH